MVCSSHRDLQSTQPLSPLQKAQICKKWEQCFLADDFVEHAVWLEQSFLLVKTKQPHTQPMYNNEDPVDQLPFSDHQNSIGEKKDLSQVEAEEEEEGRRKVQSHIEKKFPPTHTSGWPKHSRRKNRGPFNSNSHSDSSSIRPLFLVTDWDLGVRRSLVFQRKIPITNDMQDSPPNSRIRQVQRVLFPVRIALSSIPK